MAAVRALWPALSLVLISCALYANAVSHPFVHDELVFIVHNPAIGRLDDIAGIFSSLCSAPVHGINAYYRPVLELIYRLEYRFFGLDPHWYHAVNVLAHTANGVLVFLFLSRLGLSRALAWGASALFLAHPAQSEAVACVAGISNLASAFFVLICLHCYLSRSYAWGLAAFVVAMFAKETALVVPLALVLLEFLHPAPGRRSVRTGLFAGAALFFLAIRQYVTGASLVSVILASPGELYLRLMAIPRTLLTYGKIMLWPDDLHYFRNTDVLAPNAWAFAVLGPIILAGILVFRGLGPGDKRTTAFGAGWFFIFLLPVLNAAPIINEYSFIMTAEHFLYLPIIGVLLAAAVVLSRWVISPWARKVIFTVVFAACCAATVQQNNVWRGEVPLFERTVRFEPRFGRGHILLAKAYETQGRHALARQHFTIALGIMQGYAAKAGNATAKNVYLGFIREIHADLTRLPR